MLQVPGLRAPPGQLTIARILPCSSLTGNFWPQSSVFFLSFVLVTVPPDLVDTDSTLGAPLGDQTVKNLPQMQETQVWSMGKEDPPRGGHRDPLQYSYLEKRMDRGAWWATVHGVAKTQTTLSDWAHTHTLYDHHNHVQNTSRIPALFLTPLPSQLPRGCFSEHQLVMPLPEPHSSGIMQRILFVSGFFRSSWCLSDSIHAMHVSLSFNR